MRIQYEPEEVQDLSFSYLDAVASLCQVTCSVDDPEVDDSYLRNRLYSALYDLSYFLIARLKHKPPDSLKNRLHRVRELYGVDYIPYEFTKLLNTEQTVYRDELGRLGQLMESWAVRQYNKYGEIIQAQSVDHSFVMYAC